MSEDSYFELRISINPEIEDIVSDICFENFNCEGVVFAEETYDDSGMVSTTEGTLRVFLTSDSIKDIEEIKQVLLDSRSQMKQRGLSEEELGSWEISFEEKYNQDWSKKWKENWDVTHISENVVIVPSWLEYLPKENELTVSLDPGHAFGTGTHQTTQLCVVGMEQYPQNVVGKKVADIGMGTGILAIIAKKMGAVSVYGCDNDKDVILVARENAVKNNVECVFEHKTADELTEKYDFVCANILHNILAEIMPDLKNIMNDNGIMALSGILDEMKSVVIEAIQQSELTILKENHQDQWVSFVVSK